MLFIVSVTYLQLFLSHSLININVLYIYTSHFIHLIYIYILYDCVQFWMFCNLVFPYLTGNQGICWLTGLYFVKNELEIYACLRSNLTFYFDKLHWLFFEIYRNTIKLNTLMFFNSISIFSSEQINVFWFFKNIKCQISNL